MSQKGELTLSSIITKTELGFWFPLIGLGVTIALTFSSLSGRLDLINQKLDIVAEQQKELIVKYASVENRYGTMALKLQRIETVMELK